MYRDTLKQMEFEEFKLPFDGRLKSDNRWVKLAKWVLGSNLGVLGVLGWVLGSHLELRSWGQTLICD